jgi:uncharacterized protein (TIGR00369 family)
MNSLKPPDEEYENRVRLSFARQQAMHLIGARLVQVEPGAVAVAIAFRQDLTQQNGFLHAGIITTIADSACGYAAYTLMPVGSEVLTVEFKMNLLRPADGDEFLAEARVLKAGRTLTVARCDVNAHVAGKEPRIIATMLATLIRR